MPMARNQTCPRVNRIVFHFPDDVVKSSKILHRCTSIMNNIDKIVRKNGMYRNTCLILQAGAQATMRLGYHATLPRNWNSLVEVPFCLNLSKNGKCPRALDAEQLQLTEKWLTLLNEILEPFQNITPCLLEAIAPTQTVSKNFNEDNAGDTHNVSEKQLSKHSENFKKKQFAKNFSTQSLK
ncbi:unnamed protein product, partial [Nippostrongylus brasiliensis]|uniref:Uncharacterized protein n=1 Tax=Nippostrongylus brasiliensis TaxID=27835 RepID=A0A0N4XR20_NIPBR